MIESVLLDTSFLISLTNPKFDGHENAKEYILTFSQREIDMYLSSIVLSEFTARQPLSDIPQEFLDCFHHLPFTIIDGDLAGQMVGKKGELDGADRTRVKDDFKIFAQIANNSIKGFASGDKKDAKRYLEFCKNNFDFNCHFISLDQPPSVGLVQKDDLFSIT